MTCLNSSDHSILEGGLQIQVHRLQQAVRLRGHVAKT